MFYVIYVRGGGITWYHVSDLTMGSHPAMATLFLTRQAAEQKAKMLRAAQGYDYQVMSTCP